MKNRFIDKAESKFGNIFDYSLIKYINAKTKVKIICKHHGVFEQTPDKHLHAKYPCPTCNQESRKGRHKSSTKKKKCKSLGDFKLEVESKHDINLYSNDYSNYKGYTQGSISTTCNVHNTSKLFSPPRAVLQVKTPCTLCSSELRSASKTKTYNDFLKEVNTTYKGKYTYPEKNADSYINRKSKVTIICPSHGTFQKSAQKHLSGQGCFKCRMEELISQGHFLGGYSLRYFEDNPVKITTPATLYYLKIGDTYKIGVTTDLKTRLKSLKSSSKSDVDLLYSEQNTLFACFTKEQKVLDNFKAYRVYRKWSTELFCKDIRPLTSSLQ